MSTWTPASQPRAVGLFGQDGLMRASDGAGRGMYQRMRRRFLANCAARRATCFFCGNDAGIVEYTDQGKYVWIERLLNWPVPWLQNRVLLGTLARWKAIYLLNGYGHVWSMLQALQLLIAPNQVVPSKATVAQLGNIAGDDTIASGDWYVRELCTMLQGFPPPVDQHGFSLEQYRPDSPSTPIKTDYRHAGVSKFYFISGYSVKTLLKNLYALGNGNWAGPPPDPTPPDAGWRLSFRDLLAAAANP